MDGEKRYCTIEESIIQACKEVNLMRKGLMPKINAREALARLEAELEEELEEETTDKEVFVPKKKVATKW